MRRQQIDVATLSGGRSGLDDFVAHVVRPLVLDIVILHDERTRDVMSNERCGADVSDNIKFYEAKVITAYLDQRFEELEADT